MKKTNIFVAIMFLATSTLAFAGNHNSDDNSFFGFTPSASVALTTDYIWRGVSQTNNAPAIQGAFDLAHESGAYIGIWGSNIDFDNTSLELDIYAGFTNEIDLGLVAVTYDIGWLRYEYPTADGNPSAGDEWNFNEIYTGLSVSPLENLNLSVYLYHGIRIENTNPGDYREMAADYTLPAQWGGFTLLASAGQYDVVSVDGGDDYWNWKIGVSKEIAGFNVEVAYTDTDDTGVTNGTDDGKVVATISRELGADSNGGLSLPQGFEASATAALTTDYVWRGVSQTNNAPAIQGSVDLAHESGAYIGVWGSNVALGNTQLELDIYAGFANEIDLSVAKVTYDIGWLRYEYPTSGDSSTASGRNFNELYFGLATSPVENLNLSTYWYYGLKIENVLPGEYTDIAMDYTLPESLCGATLLGNVSYYNQKGGPDDYWNWKFGVAKDIGMFNVEVAYTDTDDSGVGDSTDDAKVVATLSASF